VRNTIRTIASQRRYKGFGSGERSVKNIRWKKGSTHVIDKKEHQLKEPKGVGQVLKCDSISCKKLSSNQALVKKVLVVGKPKKYLSGLVGRGTP